MIVSKNTLVSCVILSFAVFQLMILNNIIFVYRDCISNSVVCDHMFDITSHHPCMASKSYNCSGICSVLWFDRDYFPVILLYENPQRWLDSTCAFGGLHGCYVCVALWF